MYRCRYHETHPGRYACGHCEKCREIQLDRRIKTLWDLYKVHVYKYFFCLSPPAGHSKKSILEMAKDFRIFVEPARCNIFAECAQGRWHLHGLVAFDSDVGITIRGQGLGVFNVLVSSEFNCMVWFDHFDSKRGVSYIMKYVEKGLEYRYCKRGLQTDKLRKDFDDYGQPIFIPF